MRTVLEIIDTFQEQKNAVRLIIDQAIMDNRKNARPLVYGLLYKKGIL